MVYIPPPAEKRLVAVDTKVRVRATVTTIFLAVTIVAAVAAVAAALSGLLQSGG